MARHDPSTCVVCKRVFWGEEAFDRHRPCESGTWRKTPSGFEVLGPRGNIRGTYKQVSGGPYVLLEDWDLYMEINARLAKAREAKQK